MTFDEQHGWVERGTRGVHSGAVVRDLTAEMNTLHQMHLRASNEGYWWPEMPRAMRAERLEELVSHFERISVEYGIYALQTEDREQAKLMARRAVYAKLALLAPYIAILRSGDKKRQRDIAEGRHGL